MKRTFVFIALAFVLLSAKTSAAFEPETDYMKLMMEAVAAGDEAAGLAAEAARAEKIAALGMELPEISYEELNLLSKIICAEAGSAWLDLDWKMSVGEVVLNRIASPEFPDTMRGVLEQPGQYYGKNSPYFNSLKPFGESIEAAKRLLAGERVLCDSAVVFQSNGRQGSGVFRELRDAYLGSTYLCYSNHMELYEG